MFVQFGHALIGDRGMVSKAVAKSRQGMRILRRPWPLATEESPGSFARDLPAVRQHGQSGTLHGVDELEAGTMDFL
jgi:hypothetical protein